MQEIERMSPKHREKAIEFQKTFGPHILPRYMRALDRWYEEAKLLPVLKAYRPIMATVMDLDPKHTVGLLRGVTFSERGITKFSNQKGVFPFKHTNRRSHVASWTSLEDVAEEFTDGQGVVFQIAKPDKDVLPLVVPPNLTQDWFNELVELYMTEGYRDFEEEYLIWARQVPAKIHTVLSWYNEEDF